MPRIVDAASFMNEKQLRALRSSSVYRRMVGRRAGEQRRSHREAVREWLGIWWKWRCAYCKRRIAEADLIDVFQQYLPDVAEWTDDHVVPRTLGGPDSITNLVPACKTCNTEKDDMEVDEFLRLKGLTNSEVREWKRYQSVCRVAMRTNGMSPTSDEWAKRSARRTL